MQSAPSRDHPRACGEKSMVCPRSDPGTGSPPRMRGKVPDLTKAAGQAGITPAHAGKSRPLGVGRVRSWDHPRVCGEKASLNARIAVPSGSPPRMRGKGAAHLFGDLGQRITPAYAGKRSFCLCLLRPSWDHPRTCGEKVHRMQNPQKGRGSPPHMRGKGIGSAFTSNSPGITPAHAGKSRIAAFVPIQH